MSKLVTTRYEYVVYDDAQGVLSPANQLPPTYPPVLDQYAMNTVATAGNSYGVLNFNAVTSAQLIVPVGATLTVMSPTSNGNNLLVRAASNVIVSPGTTAVPSPFFGLAPGQTVTYPGVFVTANNFPYVYPCDQTLALLNTSPTFSLVVLWSL